jgi:hypothetical protein
VREFFRGWRRTAGLATLAMALLLTVGWMRSAVVVDEFSVEPPVAEDQDGPRTYHTVRSQQGVLGWEQWTTDAGQRVIHDTYDTSFSSRAVSASDVFDIPKADIVKFDWRWKWCGIDLGSTVVDDEHRAREAGNSPELILGLVYGHWHSVHYVIPYWLLVLPLTLLSAWLLLSKPRPAKPAKESSRA